jgi:radical SAM-linked protein
MRDVINKNVTEEQLLQTAERVFSRGWQSMKLYFMIGLPTEEEEDVREIVRVGARARDTGKRVKKERGNPGAPKVTVSVSTHVPKPHTPFQWCAMDMETSVVTKQGWLKEEARATGVDLRMHDATTSWLEGVFARGDRTLCDVLERAYRAGARFDSWEDQLRIDVWQRAFEESQVDTRIYLGTIPVTARLPWDHISVGLEDGFLAREYRKAVKSRLSPPCGKVAGAFVHHASLDEARGDDRKLVCYDCGVACDLTAMREERLVFLERLGAKHRVEAKPLPPPSPKRRGPPPLIVQGAARRYRFEYTKLGPSAFLSHLDLIRALPRAFRRIDVPLFYSSGFHPLPEMTFGPALSLGVAALAEVVDVKICAEVDAAAIARALEGGTPDGLHFLRGVALGPQDAGVSRIVDGARYAVAIAKSVLAEKGGVAWLEERVRALLASPEAMVTRRIEGIGKRVDVRGFVRAISVDSTDARDATAHAGLVGDLVSLCVDVDIRGSGAVKIAEVVEAITGDSETPHRAVRVAIGQWKDGALASPMELDRVRRVRTAEAEPATAAVEGDGAAVS